MVILRFVVDGLHCLHYLFSKYEQELSQNKHQQALCKLTLAQAEPLLESSSIQITWFRALKKVPIFGVQIVLDSRWGIFMLPPQLRAISFLTANKATNALSKH